MQSDAARTETTSPFSPDSFDGPAHREMMRQFAICGGPFYSLDAMWRASGSPEGRDMTAAHAMNYWLSQARAAGKDAEARLLAALFGNEIPPSIALVGA